MKKKFIEVTFDGVETFEYPLDWVQKLTGDKTYFKVLGIYERDVIDDDRHE